MKKLTFIALLSLIAAATPTWRKNDGPAGVQKLLVPFLFL
jgi:hypothetical protein